MTPQEVAAKAEQFQAKVREYMSRGMERLKACQAAAKVYPDLQQAFLLSVNSGERASRLITEKFE